MLLQRVVSDFAFFGSQEFSRFLTTLSTSHRLLAGYGRARELGLTI